MLTFAWPFFWRSSTALAPSAPQPTMIVVHMNETLLSADRNPPNPLSAYLHTLPKVNIMDWLIELFYIFLLCTVPLAFLTAHRRRKALLAHKRSERLRAVTLADLWLTPSWMVFFGLCDLYMLGVLPTGPWKARAHASLKAWDEKRYLRRLVHMGIVPLAIQEGGVATRQERPLEVVEKWPYVNLPRYVQSKRRAYFEFLVPMAKGYSQPKDQWRDPRTTPFKILVNSLLRNRHGYLVTISNTRGDIPVQHSPAVAYFRRIRELGASSWLRFLLSLKSDRVLQPARGPNELDVSDFIRPGVSPLLDMHGCPLVRIEAPDFRRGKRFDKWVYGMAQEAGLVRVWGEDALHAHASEWIRQNELELPEYLIPRKDRL